MAPRRHKLFPEECETGINHVAAYQLYISDVYLILAHCFTEPTGMPPFVMFFEDVSEMKRDQSKYILTFLRQRTGIDSIPFIQRANVGHLRTPEESLTYVLNLEEDLTRSIEDLKTLASQAGETPLVQLAEELLIKQEKCKTFLECHISTQKKLQEYRQQRRLSENPAGESVAGEDN